MSTKAETLVKLSKYQNKIKIIEPILKNWKKIWKIRNKDPLIDGETLYLKNKKYLKLIGNKIENLNNVKYQYMGLISIPKEKRRKILNLYSKIKKNKKMHASEFLNYLIKKNVLIKTEFINKGWYEFSDYEDLINFKNSYN